MSPRFHYGNCTRLLILLFCGFISFPVLLFFHLVAVARCLKIPSHLFTKRIFSSRNSIIHQRPLDRAARPTTLHLRYLMSRDTDTTPFYIPCRFAYSIFLSHSFSLQPPNAMSSTFRSVVAQNTIISLIMVFIKHNNDTQF